MTDDLIYKTIQNGVNFALSFHDIHEINMNEFGKAITGSICMFLESEGYCLVKVIEEK